SRYLISFLFNSPTTTEIYTLSLHDALPIFPGAGWRKCDRQGRAVRMGCAHASLLFTLPAHRPRTLRCFCENGARTARWWSERKQDRKSTRLNSSHLGISYAVFCLKKKNINT